VDGDGEADAPFTTSTGGLRVLLWSMIGVDVTGLRRAEIDVSLRNPEVANPSPRSPW
jgi:hypothetical protein